MVYIPLVVHVLLSNGCPTVYSGSPCGVSIKLWLKKFFSIRAIISFCLKDIKWDELQLDLQAAELIRTRLELSVQAWFNFLNIFFSHHHSRTASCSSFRESKMKENETEASCRWKGRALLQTAWFFFYYSLSLWLKQRLFRVCSSALDLSGKGSNQSNHQALWYKKF